jgi:hypothetical protein
MIAFDDLVASRKDWIESVLKPWCRGAPLGELRKAAQEWHDIAGRVDPDLTLWLWAWSRFPVLYHDSLRGLDESFQVKVRLRDGTEQTGFPDSRASRRGTLMLATGEGDVGPFSIDDVESVERV